MSLSSPNLTKSSESVSHSTSSSSSQSNGISSSSSSNGILSTTSRNPSLNDTEKFISELSLKVLSASGIEESIKSIKLSQKFAASSPETVKKELEIKKLKSICDILFSFYSIKSGNANASEIEHFKSELKTARFNLDKAIKAHNTISGDMKTLAERVITDRDLNKEKLKTLADSNNSANIEIRALNAKIIELNREITHLKSQLQKSSEIGKISALDELKAKNILDIQKKLTASETEVNSLKNKHESTKAELTQKTKEFSNQQGRHKDEIEALQKEIVSLNQRIVALSEAQKNDLIATEKEATLRKTELSKVHTEIENQLKFIAELQTKHDAIMTRLKESRKELVQLQKQKAEDQDLKASISALEQQVTQLQQELKESDAEKNRIQGVFKKVESAFHTMQAAFGNNPAAPFAIDAFESSGTPEPSAASPSPQPLEDHHLVLKKRTASQGLSETSETTSTQQHKRVKGSKSRMSETRDSVTPEPETHEAEAPIESIEDTVDALFGLTPTTQSSSSTRRSSTRLQALHDKQRSQRPQRTAKTSAVINLTTNHERALDLAYSQVEELKERETQYKTQRQLDKNEIERLKKQLKELQKKS